MEIDRWTLSGAVSCRCARAWRDPTGRIADFGCGTRRRCGSSPGVAAREFARDAGVATEPVAQNAPAAAQPEVTAGSSAGDSPLERPSRPVRQILETKDTVFLLSFEIRIPARMPRQPVPRRRATIRKRTPTVRQGSQRSKALAIGSRGAARTTPHSPSSAVKANALSVLHKFRFA